MGEEHGVMAVALPDWLLNIELQPVFIPFVVFFIHQ